jgi:alpha-amylase/alpha-mannosidase (GH57 family)
VPALLEAGMKWIVLDEGLLFKSLRLKKRDTFALYQPQALKRKEGTLAAVFRDRNLSDLLGFTYHRMKAADAVNDFLRHLQNIAIAFGDEDVLVTVAMDGENAWEYYDNDGHDFLEELYARLSESKTITTTTVSAYLKTHPPKSKIRRIASGSWIYSNFNKWMNHPLKARGWELLTQARQEINDAAGRVSSKEMELAWKQIYILEGSDWFWWLGEDPDGSFDALFRLHLANFYTLIKKDVPDYLKRPLTT